MSLSPKHVVAIAERAKSDGTHFSASEVRQLCDTVQAFQHLYSDLTRILGAVADQIGLDPVALAEDPSVVLNARDELWLALDSATDCLDQLETEGAAISGPWLHELLQVERKHQPKNAEELRRRRDGLPYAKGVARG